MTRWMAALVPMAILAGCGTSRGDDATNTAVPVQQAAAADPDNDPFVGRWNGPEGLYFQVSPAGEDGRYRILNRWTLDDEASFSGKVDRDTLSFVRDGDAETARLGTGADTGFKWLSTRKDCLIVKAGVEGYCRD